MKIAEIAQKAGVSTSIIRYYEGKGVLPRATRDSSGYRDYGESDLARIRLVTGARRLGCSFLQIKQIVAMQQEDSIPTSYLLELLEDKVIEVSTEIDRLRLVQTELARLHDIAVRLAQESAPTFTPLYDPVSS